jgi:hypothetical protein
MKNRLQIILLSGILSSCSIYNYKTIDIPKETYKPPFIDIDKSNLVLKETKFYIHDTKNRKFIAEKGILKDSSFQLMKFKKLTVKKYTVRNNRPVDLSKDETHLFLNKGVNRQSNNRSITIQTSEIDSIHKFQRRWVPKNEFVLRKRAKSALFDPNGFSKNTDKWKFYIQDIDDSTFECRNISIYDSTISATLIPKSIEREIMLNKQSLIRKNEVYLKINLSCTNKNSQIYLQPKNILGVESYMNQKDLNLQKGDVTGKIIGTVLITVLSLITAAVLTVIIAAAIIF